MKKIIDTLIMTVALAALLTPAATSAAMLKVVNNTGTPVRIQDIHIHTGNSNGLGIEEEPQPFELRQIYSMIVRPHETKIVDPSSYSKAYWGAATVVKTIAKIRNENQLHTVRCEPTSRKYNMTITIDNDDIPTNLKVRHECY